MYINTYTDYIIFVIVIYDQKSFLKSLRLVLTPEWSSENVQWLKFVITCSLYFSVHDINRTLATGGLTLVLIHCYCLHRLNTQSGKKENERPHGYDSHFPLSSCCALFYSYIPIHSVHLLSHDNNLSNLLIVMLPISHYYVIDQVFCWRLLL